MHGVWTARKTPREIWTVRETLAGTQPLNGTWIVQCLATMVSTTGAVNRSTMRVRKIGLRLRRIRQPIMRKIIVRTRALLVRRKKKRDRRAGKHSQRKQVT